MSRRKRWAILAAGIAGVVAILVVWRVWYPGRTFDPAGWRDETRVQQGIRLGMADRLIARNALRGKTRAEVVEMLGTPTMDTGYFRTWDFVYWLGPERGFISIDSEWLVLRFGRDGRVAEYRLVTD